METKTNKKQKPIKKEVIKGYNPNTGHIHCLECGIDMGTTNR